MDPISITAGTIAFIGAANAAKDLALVICDFCGDASLARHDMASTMTELHLFNSLISSSSSLLKKICRQESHSISNPGAQHRTGTFLERDNIPSNIEQVSAVLSSSLKDISNQIENFHLRFSLFKYIKWTFSVKPRIAKLRPDMIALQATIVLIIDLVQLERVCGKNNSSKYKKKIKQLEEIIENQVQTITALRKEMGAAEQGRRGVQRHSNNNTLRSTLEAISQIAQSAARNHSFPGAALNADGPNQSHEDPAINDEDSTSATTPLSTITNAKSPSNEPGLSSDSQEGHQIITLESTKMRPTEGHVIIPRKSDSANPRPRPITAGEASGFEENFISASFAKKLGLKPQIFGDGCRLIVDAEGQRIQPLGKARLEWSQDSDLAWPDVSICELEFLVCRGLPWTMILGNEYTRKLAQFRKIDLAR